MIAVEVLMSNDHPSNDHPINDTPFSPRRSSDELQRFYQYCWQEAKLDYQDAGAPFGPTDDGFLIWLAAAQYTTVN